jgi:hypothetical protein
MPQLGTSIADPVSEGDFEKPLSSLFRESAKIGKSELFAEIPSSAIFSFADFLMFYIIRKAVVTFIF